MRESGIQKACLARLEHWQHGVFWRNNCGAFRVDDGKGAPRFTSFGRAGQADITGVAYGQRVEIEIKSPEGRLRESQKQFGDLMAQHGAAYFVVDCVRRGLIDQPKAGRWSIEEVIAKLEADQVERCYGRAELHDLTKRIDELRATISNIEGVINE